ncbi:MAG: hypothetical protein AAB296_01865, partial [Candidatus Desantisbacteria bacterium]
TINGTFSLTFVADTQTRGIKTITAKGPSHDLAIASFFLQGQAEFTITKDGPKEASPASQITYTITYQNIGEESGYATLTDYLPTQTTYTTDTSGFTPTITTTTITWYLGLTGTTTKSFNLLLDLSAAATNGTKLTNVSEIAWDSQKRQSTCTTQVTKKEVKLWIEKLGPYQARNGEEITYGITYFNNGNSPATNTTITDNYPSDLFEFSTSTLSPTTATPGTITWDIGTISPQSGGSFTITGTVTGTITGSLITNTIRLSSQGIQATSTCVTEIITPAYTLMITKQGPAEVKQGADIKYDITYSNLSNTSVPYATITDTIPAGAIFVSANPSCSLMVGNQIIWYIENLKAHKSKNIKLTLKATAQAPLTLTNIVQIKDPAGKASTAFWNT